MYTTRRSWRKRSDWSSARSRWPTRISGRGTYTSNSVGMKKNSLFSKKKSSSPRTSEGSEPGSIVVTHREYLTDIYAPSTSFQSNAISINPGLNNSFPWLAQLASNYEEYEFRQLVFSYRSTTTDIGSSTTGQCGTIIMCTNYNATAAAFTDKQQMVEYAYSQSSKVTDSMEHGVECGKDKIVSNRLYVRNGPVLTQDLKSYDHGLFQIAVANAPSTFAGYPVGELWAYYTVVLRKPKLLVTRGIDIQGDYFTVPKSGLDATSTSTTGVWGALTSSDGSIMKCNLNSIGGTLKCTTSVNKVRYTLPNSFVGSLRIISTIACTGAFNGSFSDWAGSFNPGANSNIVISNCLVDPGTGAGFSAFLCSTVKSTTEATTRSSIQIAEVYVKPPVPGSTNYIDIQYPTYTVGADTFKTCVCALYVEQFQSFLVDPTDSTAVPQFIMQSTGLVTAR